MYINRYNISGIALLIHDKTGNPVQAVSQEQKDQLCRVACNEKPKDGNALELQDSGQTLGDRENGGELDIKRIRTETASG
ncbi:MAG: hypothetical protein LBI86_10170 [Treponema sp.]|nr:hypothetical protein [Treponema sp.]